MNMMKIRIRLSPMNNERVSGKMKKFRKDDMITDISPDAVYYQSREYIHKHTVKMASVTTVIFVARLCVNSLN